MFVLLSNHLESYILDIFKKIDLRFWIKAKQRLREKKFHLHCREVNVTDKIALDTNRKYSAKIIDKLQSLRRLSSVAKIRILRFWSLVLSQSRNLSPADVSVYGPWRSTSCCDCGNFGIRLLRLL